MTYLAEIEKITGVRGVTIAPLMVKQVVNDNGRASLFDKPSSRLRVIHPDGSEIAHFHLSTFPGCCGICMSFHTSIWPSYQRKGLGKLLMKMKEQIAFENGYTLMVATDKCIHESQMRIFKGAKWVKSAEFRNRRTHNSVGLFTREIQDTMIKLGFNTPVIHAP